VGENDSVTPLCSGANLHVWQPAHKGHGHCTVNTPSESADFHVWGGNPRGSACYMVTNDDCVGTDDHPIGLAFCFLPSFRYLPPPTRRNFADALIFVDPLIFPRDEGLWVRVRGVTRDVALETREHVTWNVSTPSNRRRLTGDSSVRAVSACYRPTAAAARSRVNLLLSGRLEARCRLAAPATAADVRAPWFASVSELARQAGLVSAPT